jgi:hypothetical protein
MTGEESAGDALFRNPLPSGFSRRVFRVATGLEVDLGARGVLDAIVLVEEGEIELECRAGMRRRFGRGSIIPITRPPVAHARSVGSRPLLLLSVSRAAVTGSDEFLRDLGSYFDC